ncbi:hypothetical protein PGT21_001355 [Puccinia graminis f. sp. tritici]|uniref:Uncharacterized protein n=1 Tax=Puccinia graminis f. sp. tritici TaxID=56615 RepID=A0A5B0MA05_PUCGR|nr:hypothetical protein PGT21_001355 [Puccinia graminis f. sp. tritici]
MWDEFRIFRMSIKYPRHTLRGCRSCCRKVCLGVGIWVPSRCATGLVASLHFSSIHRTKQEDWLGSNHSGGVARRVGRSQWLATFDPINLPSPEALQVKSQSLHRHRPLCPLDGR